jgi:hypothetical protein
MTLVWLVFLLSFAASHRTECNSYDWDLIRTVRDNIMAQGMTYPLFQGRPSDWRLFTRIRPYPDPIQGYFLLPDGCPCMSFRVTRTEMRVELVNLHEVEFIRSSILEEEANRYDQYDTLVNMLEWLLVNERLLTSRDEKWRSDLAELYLRIVQIDTNRRDAYDLRLEADMQVLRQEDQEKWRKMMNVL